MAGSQAERPRRSSVELCRGMHGPHGSMSLLLALILSALCPCEVPATVSQGQATRSGLTPREAGSKTRFLERFKLERELGSGGALGVLYTSLVPSAVTTLVSQTLYWHASWQCRSR